MHFPQKGSSRLCILGVPNPAEIPPVAISRLWAQVVSTWQIFPQTLCLGSEAKSIWRTRIPNIWSKHHPLHRKWRWWNLNFSWCFGFFFPPSISEQLFIYRRITIRFSFVPIFFKTGSCKQRCKNKSRSLDFEDIIANPGLNYHRSLYFWQGYDHPYLQAHFLFSAKLIWKFCKYQFRTEGRK